MIRFQSFVDLQQPDEYTAPFARLLPALRDRGISFDSRTGDLILADGDCYPRDDDRPAVLLDRNDSAALWWMFRPDADAARRHLQSEKVLALIKVSRYSNRSFYDPSGETVHSRRIRLASCETASKNGGQPASQNAPPRLGKPSDKSTAPDESTAAHESTALGKREYEKLVLGPGFWAFDACGWQGKDDVDFGKGRSLDVFCAITVNYSCPLISWHRRAALRRLTEMRNLRCFITRGRVLPPDIYHYLLRQARICVSPWGWGETCHRDYEALAAGCVLIKPKTDFIDSLLPLDERHYVACEPDFSDLEVQISRVLENWSAYRTQREANRQYVIEARNPDWLAEQCAQSLLKIVQNISVIR